MDLDGDICLCIVLLCFALPFGCCFFQDIEFWTSKYLNAWDVLFKSHTIQSVHVERRAKGKKLVGCKPDKIWLSVYVKVTCCQKKWEGLFRKSLSIIRRLSTLQHRACTMSHPWWHKNIEIRMECLWTQPIWLPLQKHRLRHSVW